MFGMDDLFKYNTYKLFIGLLCGVHIDTEIYIFLALLLYIYDLSIRKFITKSGNCRIPLVVFLVTPSVHSARILSFLLFCNPVHHY